MKKILALVAALSVVVSLVAGGSIAYLTDTAADKNTMTLGNVEIDQLEYERVVENGAWVSTGKTDKYGYTPDKLQDFENDKPLMPAVFAEGVIKWDDRNGSTAEDGTDHQQSWVQVGASGSNPLFDDSVKNVQDKFVFVKNTGKSDAYVRTIFAFEQGNVAESEFDNVIATNGDADHWKWTTIATDVEINGNEYVICEAVYLGPTSDPTGILAAGAVSYPSLLQVYMKPQADNDDVKNIDGDSNGKYDILVVSQAVQTAGFSDATTALDEAFGDITATNHPWKDGMPTTEPNPEATPTPIPTPAPTPTPVTVSSVDELKTALENGGNIKLGADITLTDTLMAEEDVVIDLNGNDITATSGSNMFQSQSNAAPKMTITSSVPGAVINVPGNSTSVLLGYGSTVIDNVTINVTGNTTSPHNPFNVYGDLTLGKGTVVNVDDLGTALISNNGKIAIVIDGAEINIGTFKLNGSSIITLNQASTLEMKNTNMKIDNFVLSPFGGDSLVSKVDGVTIENCTFDVTDSNGASCTFEAKDGKYRLVQN